MIDSFKHKGRRRKLMDLLREKGIYDENVLEAMNKIPRHLFLNSVFEEHAYEDKAFPILSNQTISQPFTVAFQSQLLHMSRGEKVLEIGTGSGYQAAVLVAMGVEVYTIERHKSLHRFSRSILQQIHFKPKYQGYGDGYKGLENYAPFDKIIVTAGANFIPKALLQQLKIGGILVIPLGEEIQVMTSVLKLDEDRFEKREHGQFQFVPMLKEKE